MVDVADLKDDDYIPDSLRETTQQFINILQKIFDQDIANPKCTIATYKEFIPMFTVLGTLGAAQLRIDQEEYYAIVDYFIRELNLLAGQEAESVKDDV